MRDDFEHSVFVTPKSRSKQKRKSLEHAARKRTKELLSIDPDAIDECPEVNQTSKSPRRPMNDSDKAYRDHGEACSWTFMTRYLKHNLGRSYNTLHSELANAVRSPDKAHHIFGQHGILAHLVTVSYLGSDGRAKHDFGHGERDILESGVGFYVDPDGILRYAPARKYNYNNEDTTDIKKTSDPRRRYQKFNGIWYDTKCVIVSDLVFGLWNPKAPYKGYHALYTHDHQRKYLRDITNGRILMFSEYDRQRHKPTDAFPISKTQLNSKDLKRLGLKNDQIQKV